jgi:hypothetical protein
MQHMIRCLAVGASLSLGTAWGHEASGRFAGHVHASDALGFLLAALAVMGAWVWWYRGR